MKTDNDSDADEGRSITIPLVVGLAVIMLGVSPFAGRFFKSWNNRPADPVALHGKLLQSAGPVQLEVMQSLTTLSDAQQAALTRDFVADLSNPNPITRRNLCAALALFGPNAKEAAPALNRLALSDDDLRVRRSASAALARLGPGASSVKGVLEGLNDSRPAMRSSALEAAGGLGQGAGSAVPVLAKLLDGSDPVSQMKAALALERIGPAASGATNALGRLLSRSMSDSKSGADVHLAAAQALGAIGPAAAPALPALLGALRDPNAIVRGGAASALQSIGVKSATVLKALAKLEADSETSVRMRALTALAKLDPGSEATTLLLRKHLQDSNPEVARQAEFLMRIKRGTNGG